MIIRAEQPLDILAIRRVNARAFGRPNEADLVDALRQHADPHISIVATEDAEVVGHIFFSPVSLGSEPGEAMGLAPMAVLPEYQRRGIGSELVREGLNSCRRRGYKIVVVLGHPQFYPRFGFIPASRKELHCEYEVPDEAFMVAELEPAALGEICGLVKYHTEFGRV